MTLACKTLVADGRVVTGAFRPTPAGPGTEYCHAEVLRRLRRRSLAALRKEVEPVDAAALARFLPAWQGVGGSVPGVDRVFEVVEQLQGAALAASVWEARRPRRQSPGVPAELAGRAPRGG